MKVFIIEKNNELSKILEKYILINNLQVEIHSLNLKQKMLEEIKTRELFCLYINVSSKNKIINYESILENIEKNNPLLNVIYINIVDKEVEDITLKNYVELNRKNYQEKFICNFQMYYNKFILLNQQTDVFKKLAIKTKEGYIFIKYENILYFECCGNKQVKLVTDDASEYIFNSTLSKIEYISKFLIRVHAGYIVNIEKIKKLTKNSVYLEGGYFCPVSRNKMKAVKDNLLRKNIRL